MSKKYKPKPDDDYLPFEAELVEIFGIVQEDDYDKLTDVPVSEELLAMVKKQGIGAIAKNFRGQDITGNAHESVVVLIRQIVQDEPRKAPREEGYTDHEIAQAFWGRFNNQSVDKPKLPREEWEALQAKREGYRAKKAAAKAAKTGSHAEAIVAKREAETGPSRSA